VLNRKNPHHQLYIQFPCFVFTIIAICLRESAQMIFFIHHEKVAHNRKYIQYIITTENNLRKLNYKQETFEKCWAHSPLRAVSHCHSPGVATVARRLRIDVHDNDDNNNDNDNA